MTALHCVAQLLALLNIPLHRSDTDEQNTITCAVTLRCFETGSLVFAQNLFESAVTASFSLMRAYLKKLANYAIIYHLILLQNIKLKFHECTLFWIMLIVNDGHTNREKDQLVK